ncbi:exosortase-associated protein EpsI, B-type [Deefgea salmonis]|uniref:EpsI family protein n=1 Tax=Deefgea salmonis TaxID=2875502 RepID=A0ABS8BIN8_9NEIS|nr:exosortase-associated protein EpsI, B-type [Deefgea salmonis]MCB5195587.1 EpsI family protein [Deefgea salmonis]
MTLQALLCGLMIFSFFIVDYIKPNKKMSEERSVLLVDTLPDTIGAWRVDKQQVNVIENQAIQDTIKKIYSDVASKTYVNTAGQRVMVSLAYVADQSDAMGVHLPEVCYPAQGFTVDKIDSIKLNVGDKELPVNRIYAVSGERHEPILYWTVTGNYLTLPGDSTKLIQLKYALSRTVPDGLLVRISTIGDDRNLEYKTQELFVTDLYKKLTVKSRERLFGVTSE